MDHPESGFLTANFMEKRSKTGVNVCTSGDITIINSLLCVELNGKRILLINCPILYQVMAYSQVHNEHNLKPFFSISYENECPLGDYHKFEYKTEYYLCCFTYKKQHSLH